ncbi:MAG: hypothetical protein ACWA5A_10125 [Marinibacterium sp.]
MKRFALSLAAIAIGSTANAALIDFESLASPTDTSVATYTEDGYTFTSSAVSGFASWGSTSPHNTGSTALFNNSFIGATTTMDAGGQAFTVKAINLSELFSFGGTSDVTFTGSLNGGGTVQQTFTLDGVFGNETFAFSNVFTDLVALSWTQNATFNQFDNIRASLDAVPLPAGGALLLSALGAGAFLRRRKRTA